MMTMTSANLHRWIITHDDLVAGGYGKTPVASAAFADLHRARLADYLERTLNDAPVESGEEFQKTLLNLELLAEFTVVLPR